MRIGMVWPCSTIDATIVKPGTCELRHDNRPVMEAVHGSQTTAMADLSVCGRGLPARKDALQPDTGTDEMSALIYHSCCHALLPPSGAVGREECRT